MFETVILIFVFFLFNQCEEAEYNAMQVLKQEVIDENEEALVPASKAISSIQKVPSISDLSDPEASLGMCFFL